MHEKHLFVLDVLRFAAALLVAGGHYTGMFAPGAMPTVMASFTGLGMTLFFVLSGFVIHYNYHVHLGASGGYRRFAAARFARLYPLYAVLLLVELCYVALTGRGACGGNLASQVATVPFYMTLTQDWLYFPICGKALVYQYGPISAVTWSISVEVFLYIVYALAFRLSAGRLFVSSRMVAVAAAAYAITVLYFWLCRVYEPDVERFAALAFGATGTSVPNYNDSFLRWLLYFNPAARLAEFATGIAASCVFLQRRGTARAVPSGLASAATFAALALVLVVHLWLYSGVSAEWTFVARIASPLYAPLVAVMMYCLVSYDSIWSRLWSLPLAVWGGEASYSIYLLHETFPSIWKRLGIEASGTVRAWAWWASPSSFSLQ